MAIGKLDNNLNTRPKTTAPRDSKSTLFEILLTRIAELASKLVKFVYGMAFLAMIVYGLGFGLLFKSLWAYYLNI